MKKIILVLLITFTVLLADYVMKPDGTLTLKTGVQETVPVEPALPTEPASYTVIPGLYSFGTDTRAAYGGIVDPIVLHVDTLVSGVSNTDSTHGSFEWCLTQKYPRIVVFDVSGIIQGRDGTSGAPIVIRDPYITIAGQTAPDNIIYNGILWVNTSDVLIQHLAVRGRSSNAGLDAILVISNDDSGAVKNVVLDHLSATWGPDEQLSVSASGVKYSTNNITIANCIIGESTVAHNVGSMNYGNNIDDKIAHIGNLYTKNSFRNPQFARWGTAAIYNCLIYDHYNSVTLIKGSTRDSTTSPDTAGINWSYQGNHIRKGPATSNDTKANTLTRITSTFNISKPGVTLNIYMADNIKVDDTPISGFDIWDDSGDGYTALSNPIDNNGYVIKAASKTYDAVVANVGPRPASRDTVDTRLINEVVAQTGSYLDNIPTPPSEPKLIKVFVPVSNPHNMYNSNYTNLEHQLHQLAATVEPAK